MFFYIITQEKYFFNMFFNKAKVNILDINKQKHPIFCFAEKIKIFRCFIDFCIGCGGNTQSSDESKEASKLHSNESSGELSSGEETTDAISSAEANDSS